MKRLAAWALLAALTAACPAAIAGPTIWDRVHDRDAGRWRPLLRNIGRMLDEVSEAGADAETLENFRRGAHVMAELSGAYAARDPEVLLVLGHVALEADVGQEERARALAERVLEQVGPDDLWLEARARVLLARAARGSPALAVEATNRALALSWDPVTRATLLRERAEAKMALGDPRGSVADYRAALAVADRSTERALSRFGLGLALERAGDLPSALAELRLANAAAPRSEGTDLGLLDMPGVWLFRPFDVHYVSALTAMALADATSSPEAALVELERALVDWERFELAAPADDPWLASARVHRAACERARDALGDAGSE